MHTIIPTEARAHNCRCGSDTFWIYEIQAEGSTLGFEAACTACGRHRALQHKVTTLDSWVIQEYATPEEVGLAFTAVVETPLGRIYECDKCKGRSPQVRNGVELQKYIAEHHLVSPTCAFSVSYSIVPSVTG